MGSWFSNIQIRRNDTLNLSDAEKIADILVKGSDFVRCEAGDSDIEVCILTTQNGQWLSAASDIFDGDIEAQIKCARALSGELSTQAMAISCFDSDYLFLNLIDAQKNVDAWASCGKYPYGKAPNRSNFAAWKPYISDEKNFRKAMRNKYLFIEDCLASIEPILSLPVVQSGFGISEIPEGMETVRFFYKSSAEKASENPPIFAWRTYDSYYGIGDTLASFLNKGDASKGVAVCIGGPAIEKDQIDVTSIKLQIHKNKHERTMIPIDFHRRTFSNGYIGLYGECPELRIPPAVPENLPPKKRMDVEFARQISVRITVELKEPFSILSENLDNLHIILIPLQNIPGQCGVCTEYQRKDYIITDRLWDAALEKEQIDYLCENIYSKINSEMYMETCKKQIKLLLVNPSARNYDLKEFYEKCIERCSPFHLKIMLIRGYAMFVGEDEIAPLMEQFTRDFTKKHKSLDCLQGYEYAMSEGGLPYLIKTYGYDCFRAAHDTISKHPPEIRYSGSYQVLNEDLEYVSIKSQK